jgi:hypothetical protein
LEGVKIMSRKIRRVQAITFEEFARREKKKQVVKEWAIDIAMLLSGCAVCYVFMWLIGAIAFVI